MTPATATPGPVRTSCCVIVRGRPDHLRRTLLGLQRQTSPPDEVVVVSMGDPRVTSLAAQTAPAAIVELIDHDEGDPLPLARARNEAARLATGDLLVFLDVDCIPAPDLVADYVAQRRPGLLMGSVRHLPPGVPPRLDDWSVAELRRHGREHPARPSPASAATTDRYELFWSLNFGVERETWLQIGGFDEDFEGYGGEDTDLAFEARRQGVRAWFLAGAEAFHQHHDVQDPPLDHLHDIVANAEHFHRKWGVWPMTGWLRAFRDRGLIEWDERSIRLTPAEVAR